ncbi:MAG: hypothetical protein AAGD04_06355 [Pseudomonadota bacterium]
MTFQPDASFMDANTFFRKTEEIAVLMEKRLGVRGSTLAERANKARRHLSSRLVKDAEFLTQTTEFFNNPKMLSQVDEPRVERAYEDLLDHLEGLTGESRKKRALFGVLRSIALNLLLLGVVIAIILAWRGFI